jgi:hypothetical protein
MQQSPDLTAFAAEIEALRFETFEIDDYVEVDDRFPIPATATSCSACYAQAY